MSLSGGSQEVHVCVCVPIYILQCVQLCVLALYPSLCAHEDLWVSVNTSGHSYAHDFRFICLSSVQ